MILGMVMKKITIILKTIMDMKKIITMITITDTEHQVLIDNASTIADATLKSKK